MRATVQILCSLPQLCCRKSLLAHFLLDPPSGAPPVILADTQSCSAVSAHCGCHCFPSTHFLPLAVCIACVPCPQLEHLWLQACWRMCWDACLTRSLRPSGASYRRTAWPAACHSSSSCIACHIRAHCLALALKAFALLIMQACWRTCWGACWTPSPRQSAASYPRTAWLAACRLTTPRQ